MAFLLYIAVRHCFVGCKAVSAAVLYQHKPPFANVYVLVEVIKVSVIANEIIDPFKAVFLVAFC